MDSSLDRWGMLLMGRIAVTRLRMENRNENYLFEIDYLLGYLIETLLESNV